VKTFQSRAAAAQDRCATIPSSSVRRNIRLVLASKDECALAVNFQEVVHSVLARNSDVAKTSVIRGRTEWTPAEPVRRYELEKPGELIHIDIKKLGKFNQIGHRITGDRSG
jgi:hypothetical protein